MISGTGIDLVGVARIRRAIEKNEQFRAKVFSEEEIAYCESRGNAFERYAGRFAAKEAFFKALGTGWRGELAFHEVEVLNDEWGKPFLALSGRTKEVVEQQQSLVFHLSISHTACYATAMVIIEKRTENENS